MSEEQKKDKNHFIFELGFQENFRCFKKGFRIKFKPGINLVVGDQGCGKSSIFYSILNWQESKIAMDYDTDSDYVFLDTESMNPRLEESFKAHRRIDSVAEYEERKMNAALTRFANDLTQQSHGEVILPLVKNLSPTGKTIFIDEPESGLSIRSQYEILNHFKKMSKKNQLIIATHSIVLIESQKEVYSLEHNNWISSKEFIESQKQKK